MALESRFYRQKGRVTMDENELMGSMKVSKAVAKMAIPSVISSLVTVVYNMADTFFVGQTGDPLQVAAVSQTNPIFILFMAFANMFGMGGSAAASMALGEKKEKKSKAGFFFYYLCITYRGNCFCCNFTGWNAAGFTIVWSRCRYL